MISLISIELFQLDLFSFVTHLETHYFTKKSQSDYDNINFINCI